MKLKVYKLIINLEYLTTLSDLVICVDHNVNDKTLPDKTFDLFKNQYLKTHSLSH